MRIDGAGGCFDNRIYEINNKSAWNLLLLTVNEMGVTVDSRDDENGILECHGKRIQVYNWKPQDKEVNLFYDLFENKLREYRAFILCPSCKAKISSLVKFCPECGVPVK